MLFHYKINFLQGFCISHHFSIIYVNLKMYLVLYCFSITRLTFSRFLHISSLFHYLCQLKNVSNFILLFYCNIKFLQGSQMFCFLDVLFLKVLVLNLVVSPFKEEEYTHRLWFLLFKKQVTLHKKLRPFIFVHEVNVTFKKNVYVDNLIKTESCLQSRNICSQSVYSPSVKTWCNLSKKNSMFSEL